MKFGDLLWVWSLVLVLVLWFYVLVTDISAKTQDQRPKTKVLSLKSLIQSRMNRRDIRNPKHLPIDLKTAETMFWQVFFL